MPQGTNGKVYYEAERILDEKLMGDELYYSIKWKGIDESGKPWTPTWEPASYCTQPLVESWEQQKRSAKRKLRSPNQSSSSKISSIPKRDARRASNVSGGSSNGHDSDSSYVNNESGRATPMLIDSVSTTPVQIKTRLMINGADDDNPSACQMPAIHRLSLRQQDVMLPVPLSLMQQKLYRKILTSPKFYQAFANSVEPLHPSSPIISAKNQLLNVVNHISLLAPSNNGHGSINWIKDVDQTGKLVMMRQLLKVLSNKNIVIGIALAPGLMMDIFRDFLESHGHQYRFINESSQLSSTGPSQNKLLCVIFSTALQYLDNDMPHINLLVAYDSSFIPQTHLFRFISDMNVPIIRLVSKNTVDHAINYYMLVEEKTFSDLTLSEIQKVVFYGTWKKNQNIIPGCEVAQFDINGVCDKINNWVDEGMLRILTFGMEASIEKNWGKPIVTSRITSQIPDKWNQEISEDSATSKRRKDKETVFSDERPQKTKKIKTTTTAINYEVIPDCAIKCESPEIKPMRLNTPVKEQLEIIEDWKQKFIELCNKNTQREELIKSLQQDNNKSRDLTNELSAQLASTRRQLGELNGQRRIEQDLQNGEIARELAITRHELADLKSEHSKIRVDFERKDQECQTLIREIKAMKSKMTLLQDENIALKIQGPFTSKVVKRSDSLDDEPIKNLATENKSLRLQCQLYEQHIKIATEGLKQQEATTKLLMDLQGLPKDEVDMMLEQNQTQSAKNSSNGRNNSLKSTLKSNIGVAAKSISPINVFPPDKAIFTSANSSTSKHSKLSSTSKSINNLTEYSFD